MRVVDFSADFRLNDATVYEQTYGLAHPDPERMTNTVYGLPELYRDSIRSAPLVANPGCFPTTAILSAAPLLEAGVIEPDVIVDSKTGVSGAGRTAKLPISLSGMQRERVGLQTWEHIGMGPKFVRSLATLPAATCPCCSRRI